MGSWPCQISILIKGDGRAHVHSHTHAHSHALRCSHACSHMLTHMHAHTVMLTHICSHTCSHSHALRCSHRSHTHAHTCSHTHAQAHTRFHVLAFTCMSHTRSRSWMHSHVLSPICSYACSHKHAYARTLPHTRSHTFTLSCTLLCMLSHTLSHRCSLSLSQPWEDGKTTEKVASCQPGRKTSAGSKSTDVVTLDSQPQNYEKMNFCCISHPGCGACYGSLSQPTPVRESRTLIHRHQIMENQEAWSLPGHRRMRGRLSRSPLSNTATRSHCG